MKTILLTAIAGDVAQAAAIIIRETFPNWRLIGCDIHDRHGGELFVDISYVAPRADSPDYLLWIESIIVKENVDICMPLSEAELIFFAKEGIKKVCNANLVMPNARAIEIGSDKLATAQFIESIGYPAPWTIPADECNEKTLFPCIFKPRRGAGSKAVFICNKIEEVFFFSERYPGGILQELLLPEDNEVTCAVYRTKDGDIVVLQLLRKLVGGSTSWAQVIDNSDIYSLCKDLAVGLELRGSINVQLRVTSNGPRIFEINPRFSSTVLIRHHMGFCDLIWTINELNGDKAELTLPPRNLIGVRTYGASVLNNDLKIEN